MCGDVHGCVQVCAGVCECVQVCAVVRGGAWMCTGMCGMNFQNTYWRLES